MRVQALIIGGVAFAISASLPALGHHSFAMFDAEKKLTVEGSIKEFQWTNPHSWILVLVPDKATGKPVQWAIELGAPGGLSRAGWNPKSIVPGDKVAITMHPLKNGNPGGQYMSITLPNGKVMGNPDVAPSANAN